MTASRRSVTTLLIVVGGTLAVIGAVHSLQLAEKKVHFLDNQLMAQKMHEGLFRDLERQKRKEALMKQRQDASAADV